MALALIAALTFVSFVSAGIAGFVGIADGVLLLGAMLALGVDLRVAVPVHEGSVKVRCGVVSDSVGS